LRRARSPPAPRARRVREDGSGIKTAGVYGVVVETPVGLVVLASSKTKRVKVTEFAVDPAAIEFTSR